MKKHWWIALVLVFALAIPAAASQVIKIYVNGAELKSDVAAQVINGRTMVPIRAIAEYFGKTVDYNETTKTVSITGKTNIQVVSAIAEEWAEGGHASSVGEPLAYAGPRAGCVPCHSGNGLERFGSDNPYKAAGIVNNADDKVNTLKFDPHTADLPTPIGCSTCHTGLGQSLINSGIAKASLANISNEDFKAPGSALCISCHNGRRNTKDLYLKAAAGNIDAGGYPHNSAAIATGKGGMEYPGVTYAGSKSHENLGCVGCHMPKTESGYTSHKFEMQEANIATCNKCHIGQTEFTMGGNLKKEITEKLAELQTLAVAKVPGAVKIGGDRLSFPFADKDGKRIDVKLVPLEAYVAAYNYYTLKDDLEKFSAGAHNPQYAKSLLNESIKRLK